MSNQVQQFDPETGEVGNLPVGYTGQDSSLAVSLARAEVDQQVATARALPRQPARVMASILSLATLDEKTAEECVYALPRGGKPIKGPSVRLAEIIGSQWGNCRIGARVVHVDRIEKYVEAEGVFHDLETNAATTARVRRRIVDSKGRLYNDDMIVVTGNAACAIAKRNAILGAVPKAVWRKAYEAVESVIAGDAVTLVERRDKAMKAFAAFGVTPERVCAALAIAGPEEITLEHMPILMGAHSALKSGEATVEELFPVEKGSSGNGAKPKSLADRLDALAVQPKEKKQKSDSQASSRAGSDGEGTRDAHSSGQGASDTRSPSGESPPSTPAPDGDAPSSQEAYEAGQQARAKGVSRKAVPQRFSGDEHLLEQWLAGFDGDVDEREPGEEG